MVPSLLDTGEDPIYNTETVKLKLSPRLTNYSCIPGDRSQCDEENSDGRELASVTIVEVCDYLYEFSDDNHGNVGCLAIPQNVDGDQL